MKKYLTVMLMFVLGMLVLGVASADSPVVAPSGGDARIPIDLSNASVEEAPIVIAGAPRVQVVSSISCCNSDGSCQVAKPNRCFIQGGTQAPSSCTVTPPAPDPVCTD